MVTTEQTLSQSSTVKTTSSTTFQQEAFLVTHRTLNKNATIKGTMERSLLQDGAVILLGQLQPILQNATVKTSTERTILQDAILKDTFTKTLSQNAYIKAVQSQTISQNTTVKNIVEQSLLQNTTVKTTQNRTIEQNSTVKLTVTQALGQNASLFAQGVVRLLFQDSRIIILGATQTVTQNAQVKTTQTLTLNQNAHVKDNPAAGPVNVAIDVDSIVSPIVNKTEFPVVLTLTSNNGIPLLSKAVFLQRAEGSPTTWKTVKKGVTDSVGVAVIKFTESLFGDFVPKKIFYRGFFQGEGLFGQNTSTAVEVSVQSGNLRNPTPFPLTGPNQAVTLMKGTDTYILLPDGKWLRLPKVISENFGKFTVESNT